VLGYRLYRDWTNGTLAFWIASDDLTFPKPQPSIIIKITLRLGIHSV